MSYKTIVVHVDPSMHAPARIGLAAALANDHDAHLIGAAMTGISRFVDPAGGNDLARTALAGVAEKLHDHARQALDQFERLARAANVRSWERRLVADDPEGGLVLLSRFCDLLVLSQTDPAHAVGNAVRDLPEYVMLSVARPVLLVPYAGAPQRIEGKALLAWDGGLEASRAAFSGLPLLRRAREVVVARFGEQGPDVPGNGEPDLLAWLARHNINASIEPPHPEIGAGNALLSLAFYLQAGLIVMGGYGHTRFRELLLGGVTKTVLESMTVPVLMAH
jgi:nucleotide-binding universal stress UspA family protein